MRRWWLAASMICLASILNCPASADPAPSAPEVLAVLRDYESDTLQPGPAILQWNWTDAQKAEADKYSRLSIADGTPFGQRCLKLMVSGQLPWGKHSMYRVTAIGPDYLPPQADAVRLRVKVVRGKFMLAVGGPTVYFGHSDVFASPQTVEPSAEGQWQTLEFSLNENLMRNFRRARFARNSPVISYTRWIQEPLYLNVMRGSEGEMLIDQVELLARGQGRDYPTFDDASIRRVGTIADFENADEMSKAFTFLHEPVDFTREPKLIRASWDPPMLRHVPEGKEGKFSLVIEKKGTEEVAFAGLKVQGVPEANAIAFTIKAEHPDPLKEVVVDFVVYITSEGRPLEWNRFAPPIEWQKQEKIGFTYYLSQEAMRETSYAMYHARRAMPKGQWQRLVIPLADFQCVYGQADCEPMFRRQLPLDSRQIVAIGLVPPYRQRAGVTRLTIDDAAFFSVPGKVEALRSFWQHPDAMKLILEPLPDEAYGGVRQRSADR